MRMETAFSSGGEGHRAILTRMITRLVMTSLILISASTATAQSLYVADGERAAEGSAAWSVGPSSNGLEVHGAASLNGRWDVGFGVNSYNVDVPGGDQTFSEWTPFVRYFLFKEDDDSVPVSLSVGGQYFRDNYEGDDEGWYALFGATVAKRLTLSDGFSLYPYLGFSLATESYTFGDADPARSTYLTRQLGVHGLLTLTDGLWLRVTAEEHAFRRETYRAVRVAVVSRF
jgi:hypothetical protein